MIPCRPIQVGIIPSWMAEKLAMFGRPKYELFLEFSKALANAESSQAILTVEEVNYYIAIQLMKPHLLGDLFDDIPSIVWSGENLNYLTSSSSSELTAAGHGSRMDHDMLLTHIGGGVRKILDSERLQRSIAKAAGEEDSHSTLTTPEHYTPLYVDSNVLLLIGSEEPAFADDRSFCDAALAALGDNYDFTQLKRLRLMRNFLRDHI